MAPIPLKKPGATTGGPRNTYQSDRDAAFSTLAEEVIASTNPVSWNSLYKRLLEILEQHRGAGLVPERKSALQMSTQKFCYELSILTKSNTGPPHF
ncbi:hypothetical protein Ciccas_010819 [Cichlidogyrus casuarinus]|uniref:Uncharacterized protein n=1 Tax=Cichlidogyrus casuarinus TaxID=1844966 RepID=A0ABD2PUN9_9PLAT